MGAKQVSGQSVVEKSRISHLLDDLPHVTLLQTQEGERDVLVQLFALCSHARMHFGEVTLIKSE